MPDTYEERIAALAKCPICGGTPKHDLELMQRIKHGVVFCAGSKGSYHEPLMAIGMDERELYRWDNLCECILRAAALAQSENDRLVKGIRELLTFLDNIRCGLAMSHSNATCIYYKELGEHFAKLTALIEGSE